MAQIITFITSRGVPPVLKRPKKPLPEQGYYLHSLVGAAYFRCVVATFQNSGRSRLYPPGGLPDERMQQTCRYFIPSLKTLDRITKKGQYAGGVNKNSPNRDGNERSPGRKIQTAQRMMKLACCREKLEAIRCHGKHLDESGDAK